MRKSCKIKKTVETTFCYVTKNNQLSDINKKINFKPPGEEVPGEPVYGRYGNPSRLQVISSIQQNEKTNNFNKGDVRYVRHTLPSNFPTQQF